MSVFCRALPAAFVCALATLSEAQTLQQATSALLAIDDAEITPDERFLVVRQNRSDGYVRVYDLATGLLAAAPPVGTFVEFCGEVLDAVAVTNDRGIVLGGVTCTILDLNNIASPVLATPHVGFRPNDVAITPDGTIAAVRGGRTSGSAVGGQYLFDLAGGAQIGFHPGEPPLYDYSGTINYSFDTDSVAVTNRHAAMLSIVNGSTSTPTTRVTIWDLHPGPGAMPAVILETGTPAELDLRGAPHDLAITPDGTRLVVRSEGSLAVWTLNGATAARVLASGLAENPGMFDDQALDSVEVTDTLAVTLSNVTNPALPAGLRTQVDVFTFAGGHHVHRLSGRPHDLAITPDGTRLAVRTSAGVALFDLAALPAWPVVEYLPAPSANTQYLAGLDSVALSDEVAVTLTSASNQRDTEAWFWSIARGHLAFLSKTTITNSRPTDVVIAPGLRTAVVSGNSSLSVFHLGTGSRSFEVKPVGAHNFFQWCDGAVASANRAAGFGQWQAQNGWIAVANTAPFAARYCTANPNSSGRAASILALGDASVTNNRLKLCVDGAPANARGRFLYGPTQVQIPFGDGVQCVGGTVFGLRFLDTNAIGSGFLPVQYGAQTDPAGVIAPGSTWHFQFAFLDQGSSGFGFNTSDAVSIVFAP